MDTIDELYVRWKSNPSDVSETVRLCEALQGSNRVDLVAIVGEAASRQLEVPALLAVARMYTETGRLDDAQSVLVAAGRLAPREGEIYNLLGEVLLRRGDAERAEKVLERAVQYGARAAASRWLERARALLPKQRAMGPVGVAEEVAKIVERERKPAPGRGTEDDPTRVRGSLSLPTAPANPSAQTASVPLPPPVPGALASASAETAAFAAPALAGVETEKVAALAAIQPFSAPAPAVSPPAIPVNPVLAALAARPAPEGTPRLPEPRDVLEALQIAGIFEPDGAVKPHAFDWDKAQQGKRRTGSYAALFALAGLVVGGVTGTYYYVKDRRAKDHVEAEAILAKIDTDLRAAEGSQLDPAEKGLSRAFELENRSPHAALTWLHERAMTGLLKSGENVAFEDAATRAKEVGIEEKKIAFAYVASFLFQNDTAGAAATVAKWDGKADDDAWYQLLAGATFERAGDPRALERYAAAARLDPDLVAAKFLLAKATAVDGEPQKAVELAKEFKAKYPGRVEGGALVALGWSRDPLRGEPPPEVKDIVDKADALPAPLRAVPYAARAMLALEQHKIDEAKPALQKGLAVADTPGIAAWLGSIALSTGDEQLARKAALAAVSFSAVYPPARVLAARVALLGARLDEALKAAEDLPPSWPDVAVVTAAVAYEKVDGERMSRALDAIPQEARKLPFLLSLVRGQALLAASPSAIVSGAKALDIADDEGPWSDLVAMDAALDAGDVDLAEKIAAQWKGDVRSLRALRLARLARYEGKNDDAEKLSRMALEGATVTVRSLAERVFVLVSANKAPEAIALFKTYPNVGGPLAKWLRAYAIASAGKIEEARAIISQEDPPPPLSPLPARLYAAAAYGATKDVRHGADYVKALAQTGFSNPDLAAAAEKVGAARIPRRGR